MALRYYNELDKHYLLKINALVEANNENLLTTMAPVYESYYQKSEYNKFVLDIQSFCLENEITFHDLNQYQNLCKDSRYYMNQRTINSNQHLNTFGAVEATLKMASFMNNKEGFKDGAIQSNAEIVAENLREINTLPNYIDNLRLQQTIVLSGQLKVLGQLKGFAQNTLIKHLGFSERLFQSTKKTHYISMIYDFGKGESIAQVRRVRPFKTLNSELLGLIDVAQANERAIHSLGEQVVTFPSSVNVLHFTVLNETGAVIDAFSVSTKSKALKIVRNGKIKKVN